MTETASGRPSRGRASSTRPAKNASYETFSTTSKTATPKVRASANGSKKIEDIADSLTRASVSAQEAIDQPHPTCHTVKNFDCPALWIYDGLKDRIGPASSLSGIAVKPRPQKKNWVIINVPRGTTPEDRMIGAIVAARSLVLDGYRAEVHFRADWRNEG